MRWSVRFKDGTQARIAGVQIRFTYERFLEGDLGRMTQRILEERAERMPMREAPTPGGLFRREKPGRVLSPRGYYLLDPEFMHRDEFFAGPEVVSLPPHCWVYWSDKAPRSWEECRDREGAMLKDYELHVGLEIPSKEGMYALQMEWFQSTEELMSHPLHELIMRKLSEIDFKEVKDFCRFTGWDEF